MKAVDLILSCKGKLYLLCRKVRSNSKKNIRNFFKCRYTKFFCDPAQALHGDMGQIEKGYFNYFLLF